MRPITSRTYWTKQRVLLGLKRLYRERKTAPISTAAYREATRDIGKRQKRRYPSHYGVLRYWSTFREAWAAAGIQVDRHDSHWTEIEDWYLREASGFIPRVEIARDLRRTPDAIHRRLYDLALNARVIHGWTLNRIQRATGVAGWRLRDHYAARGLLPARRGTVCFYVDPADLVVVKEIDWPNVDRELVDAVRRAWAARLVNVLTRRVRA